MDGYLSRDQVEAVHEEILVLLHEVRPDAVALVDAFGLDDYYVNSALGAYDGDVYTRLYNWVQVSARIRPVVLVPPRPPFRMVTSAQVVHVCSLTFHRAILHLQRELEGRSRSHGGSHIAQHRLYPMQQQLGLAKGSDVLP